VTWEPTFLCSTCGKELKSDGRHLPVIWLISLVGGSITTWNLGFRGFALVFVSICLILFFLFLGIFLYGLVFAPGYKLVQNGKPFDRVTSLRLTDKLDTDEKNDS
jgi:hypothetical protein